MAAKSRLVDGKSVVLAPKLALDVALRTWVFGLAWHVIGLHRCQIILLVTTTSP